MLARQKSVTLIQMTGACYTDLLVSAPSTLQLCTCMLLVGANY